MHYKLVPTLSYRRGFLSVPQPEIAKYPKRRHFLDLYVSPLQDHSMIMGQWKVVTLKFVLYIIICTSYIPTYEAMNRTESVVRIVTPVGAVENGVAFIYTILQAV